MGTATSVPAASQNGAPQDDVDALYGLSELEPGAPNVSIRTHLAPREARRAAGKALRERAPRAAHGDWEPAPRRRDPVAMIKESNKGRVPELVPIRMGRMTVSPFTFFRGAAGIMAADLAGSPDTGLHGWICGDAHLTNFGYFGSSEAELTFDLNDFDEAIRGPWEWDLKRLVASVHVAGRDLGHREDQCSEAVELCVAVYRASIDHASRRTLLENHHARVVPENLKGARDLIHKRSAKVFAKAAAKAHTRTNAQVMQKMAVAEEGGHCRFQESPPIVVRLPPAEAKAIVDGLERYLESLVDERRELISNYGVVDVCRRIVGVGSVGTRPYVVMLIGDGSDDPLFLQVKEAPGSQLQPYLPAHGLPNEGQRVVWGKRVLQARSGPFLGWTTIQKRDYYVRQLRDKKGAVEVADLDARGLRDYALVLGGVLAAAHARAFDPSVIAGYCGKGDALDRAFARFAKAYADRNEADFDAIAGAIAAGKLPCEPGI